MKKITITMFVVFCVVFVGRCYYENKKPSVPPFTPVMTIQSINNVLSNRAGNKKTGTEVKSLISFVTKLNEQEVFPIDIRYGDVLPNSYSWTASTTPNLNLGDYIKDSGWYEVVIQDQLPEDNPDMYLDTIAIRPYEVYAQITATDSISLSGE